MPAKLSDQTAKTRDAFISALAEDPRNTVGGAFAELMASSFDIPADSGNGTARDYGLIMSVYESLRPLYLQRGIDLPAAKGDTSCEPPVPVTCVVDSAGKIRAAWVDRDYTKRKEPEAIVAALPAI